MSQQPVHIMDKTPCVLEMFQASTWKPISIQWPVFGGVELVTTFRMHRDSRDLMYIGHITTLDIRIATRSGHGSRREKVIIALDTLLLLLLPRHTLQVVIAHRIWRFSGERMQQRLGRVGGLTDDNIPSLVGSACKTAARLALLSTVPPARDDCRMIFSMCQSDSPKPELAAHDSFGGSPASGDGSYHST